jgi:hypothetical protein
MQRKRDASARSDLRQACPHLLASVSPTLLPKGLLLVQMVILRRQGTGARWQSC